MGFTDAVKVTIRKFVVGSGRSSESVGTGADDKLQAVIKKFKMENKRRKHERVTGSVEGK